MNTLSKEIWKEWNEIKPLINYYLYLFRYTEIVHIPLYYGTFKELHFRMKPNL